MAIKRWYRAEAIQRDRGTIPWTAWTVSEQVALDDGGALIKQGSWPAFTITEICSPLRPPDGKL